MLGRSCACAAVDQLLARHTGVPLERVRKDADRDFIMTAEEARSYGIVDDVITALT
jgi:ATP-dependent Clp protease protease subunit